jgi:hypothetical protein
LTPFAGKSGLCLVWFLVSLIHAIISLIVSYQSKFRFSSDIILNLNLIFLGFISTLDEFGVFSSHTNNAWGAAFVIGCLMSIYIILLITAVEIIWTIVKMVKDRPK